MEFGIKHSLEYISSLWRKKIPKLIASQAEDEYLYWYYLNIEKGKYKKCSRCGQVKLAHNKYFVKNWVPKSVISYCDFSKFTGNSYEKLGFKKERLNKPGFVWWNKKTNEIYWRNPYKNREMIEKGYLKIYDCGQLVFSWFN